MSKDIAYKLKVNIKTVDFHKTNIYRKLGISSVQELITTSKSIENVNTNTEKKNDLQKPQTIKFPINLKDKKRFIALIAGVVLVFSVSVFSIWYFLFKPSDFIIAEKPFIITLGDNDPWGWWLVYHPPVFNDIQIKEGDEFTFYYSFTSDVSFLNLEVCFLDAMTVDGVYSNLSNRNFIRNSVIAGFVYSGRVTIIAENTATSSKPNSNLFFIQASPYIHGVQPTLTFTRFELVKTN
ncbi:MAG: helix-turn-helix transcriptional regulator [Treponema sp.]|nr:helix-turn-helix transcriptional regulator [Treponema sp.]